MKKLFLFILLSSSVFLAACGKDESVSIIGGADGPTTIIVAEEGGKTVYSQILPEEAKKIMDSETDIIILDVREQAEFDEGHIPGAVLLSYTEIGEKAEAVLPDKNAKILVYCRSGRRSKIAAQALAKLGYTNILEFGGIIDWPYEVEK